MQKWSVINFVTYSVIKAGIDKLISSIEPPPFGHSVSHSPDWPETGGVQHRVTLNSLPHGCLVSFYTTKTLIHIEVAGS